MDKNKIEIKDLYLIFGSERNKAFKMLKKGKSKSEILKETGCTVAELDSLLQVMRDKYDGLFHLRLQGQQLVLHLYPYQRVQGGEGLVHQQDFRIIR